MCSVYPTEPQLISKTCTHPGYLLFNPSPITQLFPLTTKHFKWTQICKINVFLRIVHCFKSSFLCFTPLYLLFINLVKRDWMFTSCRSSALWLLFCFHWMKFMCEKDFFFESSFPKYFSPSPGWYLMRSSCVWLSGAPGSRNAVSQRRKTPGGGRPVSSVLRLIPSIHQTSAARRSSRYEAAKAETWMNMHISEPFPLWGGIPWANFSSC